MKNNEKIIKAGDIVVIALLLVLSLIIFLTSLPSKSTPAATVVVSVDGEIYGRYSIDKDREITVESRGHVNIIEINGGAVRVKSADCPDRTCVSQGWISKGGEVIVCLPARLTVTLEGGQEQVDTIVY